MCVCIFIFTLLFFWKGSWMCSKSLKYVKRSNGSKRNRKKKLFIQKHARSGMGWNNVNFHKVKSRNKSREKRKTLEENRKMSFSCDHRRWIRLWTCHALSKHIVSFSSQSVLSSSFALWFHSDLNMLKNKS